MAAPPPSEKRQVVRYAFYKLDLAWRRLTAERQASAKLEFGETLERYNGRLLLRPYGLVGIRGDTDFLLWQVAEDLDALVELQTALNRTDLGAVCSSTRARSEEHTSELQSRLHLVCRLLLEKKKKKANTRTKQLEKNTTESTNSKSHSHNNTILHNSIMITITTINRLH